MIDIPATIIAGTTVSVDVTLTDYPADAWTLTIALRGPSVVDLTGVADGTDYVISAAASATAQWLPGTYAWSATATKNDASEVVNVGTGQSEITPNLAAATAGYVATTHAQRVLAAIEAVIERRATTDQESYKIGTRELKHMPIGDLLKFRSMYRNEVASERRARAGGDMFRQIRVRF